MASVREYAILYVRGTRTGGTVIGGGNAVLTSGQHALDGAEHTNLDAYVKATLGGEEGFLDHGSVGATETIDPADANWHAITLDANCTLTLVATTDDKGNSLLVEVIQDGTGGWTLTLPASVVNKAELEAAQDTTASTTQFLVLIQRDATNWYGFWAGGSGGGSSLTVEDEGTPLATSATTLDFVGAGVTASGTGPEKTITIPGLSAAGISALGFVGPIVMADGITSPPEPLWNDDGTDYLYSDL